MVACVYTHRLHFIGGSMDRETKMSEKILNGILGQYGALVIACAVLYFISMQYKETLDLMMQRCEDDRQLYHTQMEAIVQKLDSIHIQVKDCKHE